MSLFLRLLGRRFLLVADRHEDMAGSLGDAVAAALGARLEALERHGRSTKIRFTLSSSTSAPSLCSALAIADSSTFLMMCAPFFGLKASRLSAFSTGSPRIWSATSRPFWADSRTP